MTDAILRAYYTTTSLTSIPFPFTEPFVPTAGSALDLLHDETDGYAIDATTYDDVTAAAFVGGPVGGTVAVINTGDPTDDLDDVPLNVSNLTNAGTSPKMVHHVASPYVRWSPHNLLITAWSEDGSTWLTTNTSVSTNTTVAPDGTTTADTVTDASSGTAGYIGRYIGGTTGQVICASVYIKKTSGATNFPSHNFYQGGPIVGIVINTDAGTVTNASSGGGVVLASGAIDAGTYWRAYIVFTSSGADDYYYQPAYNADASATQNVATTGDSIVWGFQINRGYAPGPYVKTVGTARIGIPQSYDTPNAKYGILVESACTNLCLSSEVFGNTDWNRNQVSILGQTTAPDGSNTADILETDSSTNIHLLWSDTITTTASTTYTASAYLKAGLEQYAVLVFCGDATNNRWVGVTADLTNGTITQSTNGAGGTLVGNTITAIGGGWYRLTITGSHGDSGSQLTVQPVPTGTPTHGNSGNVNYLATGLNINVWGTQLELGSVATSYVPTLGATATRAIDYIEAATTTFPISGGPGTIYLDALALTTDTTGSGGFGPRALGLNDADNIGAFDSANVGKSATAARFNVVDAATGCDMTSFGSWSGAVRAQITGGWTTNDFAASVDGGAIETDVSGSGAPTVSTMILGSGSRSQGNFGGLLIYRVVIVPRKVVNATIPTWRYNF